MAGVGPECHRLIQPGMAVAELDVTDWDCQVWLGLDLTATDPDCQVWLGWTWML
jgi:hypothetical protein